MHSHPVSDRERVPHVSVHAASKAIKSDILPIEFSFCKNNSEYKQSLLGRARITGHLETTCQLIGFLGAALLICGSNAILTTTIVSLSVY